MMNLFADFFGFGTTSTAPASKPAVETAPKFLLPETAEEYRRLLAEADERYRAEYAGWETTRADILERARVLEATEGTPAQRELNRREAEALRRTAPCQPVRPWGERGEIEKTARAGELERIAHEGQILSVEKEKFDNPKKNRFAVRERRVVEFGGRHFLVLLEYEEVTRDTGRREERPTGYMGRLEEWEVLEKTGEYQPPVVLWGTDALAQFTEQELRATM